MRRYLGWALSPFFKGSKAATPSYGLPTEIATEGAKMLDADKYHTVGDDGEFYRHDGVRITHDPFAHGMAEKYGMPGQTDHEGFDPYRDSVGPGIYGGIVKRDAKGQVVIGRQYQNHNPRPGPVYAGGGYTPSSQMLEDPKGRLGPLVQKFPDLVNDITTGGAQPLHMCGMSPHKQEAVTALVERGADIEALDTYGFTPLHRMASNNLAKGAEALIAAGADVFNGGSMGESPMKVAQQGRSIDVMNILAREEGRARAAKSRGPDGQLTSGRRDNIKSLNVMGSGVAAVNGDYEPRSPVAEIPTGFAKVCDEQGWNTKDMWQQLNGVDPVLNTWFKHAENDSYIYWNKKDHKWWIDGPDGNGVFIAKGPWHAPPAHGWTALGANAPKLPMVRTFRDLGKAPRTEL